MSSAFFFIHRWAERDPGLRYPLLMVVIIVLIGLGSAVAPPMGVL